MSSTIVGIDIGSVSVRAVELRNADKPKPIVVKYGEMPLPEGSVRRGEVIQIGTVATALKRLWANNKFSTKDVVLGMGGPRVFSRDLVMPLAPLPQIREALPFHVQELLPMPVTDALLDFYPISEGVVDGAPVVNGLLIAAIKEAVAANIAAVTEAGLRPVQVDLIPFALVRALTPIRAGGGLDVVVSIGANTTNVVVVNGGVPQFVRIIAAGGDDVTRALASRLQLSPGQAEAAKRELGLGSAATRPEHIPLVEVIVDVVRDQLTAIRNTLSYYASSKPGAHVARVVLSGGGSQLQGLPRALSEVTGLQVVLATAIQESAVRTSRETEDALTTAYALALGSVA